MNPFIAWPASAMLVTVIIGCYFHLNNHSDWHAPWCQKLGFILTAIGCLLAIIVLHRPDLNRAWVPLVLYTGMFFIVLAIYQGDFRAWLALARRYIPERRKAQKRIDHTERRRVYEHNG